MASIAASLSSLPIPPKLYKNLAQPTIPWALHDDLFERVREQEWSTSDNTFKSCEVLPSDPEYDFVHEYFRHGKPPGACITKITCLHNPSQTITFEVELKNMEVDAKKFLPQGSQEEPRGTRAKALQRWHDLTEPFSPLKIKAGRRVDKLELAKALPLWHGTSQANCESIASSGFSYFGKHHFFGTVVKAPQASTDIGYFGSGIYFTNSARYATLYSEGRLLLSWVSMREPYPVVSDIPHPTKCQDMRKLEGKGAYQNYNAHYIPVVSLVPDDPANMEYHPVFQNEEAPWDEIVVFQKAQTLPRFSIELGTELPPAMPAAAAMSKESGQPHASIEDLLDHILTLLDKQTIQQDPQIGDILKQKAKTISVVSPEALLSSQDIKFYHCTKNLIDRAGKVRLLIKENLLEMAGLPAPSVPKPLVKAPPLSSPAQAHAPAPPLASPLKAQPLPACAFGKAKWEQYLGDIEQEPPLPPDIQTILASPCPFFPGKTVQETHSLVLIPQTVSGRPLTLNSLGELVKKARQGSKTQYDSEYCWEKIFDVLGETPAQASYWILMTKDVLAGSRSKSYADQQKLVESYRQKTKVPYEVPHILEATVSIFLEYVQKNVHLYPRSSLTYTRCQEAVDSTPVAVGGFAPAGLGVLNADVDYEGIGVGAVRQFFLGT